MSQKNQHDSTTGIIANKNINAVHNLEQKVESGTTRRAWRAQTSVDTNAAT